MKRGPIARIILTLFFVALIAVPVIVSRISAHKNAAAGHGDQKAAMARYGFYLTDVSNKAGVHFIHEAPRLDPKLEAIMPEVASMGASVSIVDYNRDGWPDIYVTNSRQGSMNALYRNNHDGTFTDVAPELGIADVNKSGTGVSMGAVWGDYDNDGYPDLYLIKWGKPMLFHNDDGHGFTDVSAKAGLPDWINANTALWFDYDRDGKLDLFVGGYYNENIDLWHLKTTKIMPDSFEYADNGGRKYLFHNLGGRFDEVSAQVGIKSRRWALASGAADLTGNGYPDLFIANDYGVSELYVNDSGRFHEAGEQTGVGFAPKSGMNVAFGDIFNQGRYSIYVSNISEPGILIQGNNMWVPQDGASSGKSLHYENLARDLGVELGGWSFGAQFGDFNNDGNLDLFLTNGYVSLDRDKSYWYDFAKVAGGNSSIIGDAKNWPAFDGRSLSGYQQKRVWINDGAGKFEDVARAVGVTDTHDGRSVAVADLWNNGALDVVVANQSGPLLIYRNHVDPAEKWLELALEGTKSNRDAIGAQVTLYWNGHQQIQEVEGGNGFAAQNDLRLHFGLGKHPQIAKAVIHWPSGTVQTLDHLTPDQLYHVKEPE
jgi:hypothetical protein